MIGSISFGSTFDAGSRRVPRPATGNTAFLTFIVRVPSVSFSRRDWLQRRHPGESRDPMTLRAKALDPGFRRDDAHEGILACGSRRASFVRSSPRAVDRDDVALARLGRELG